MAGSNQRVAWSHRMQSYQNKQVDINRLIINYLLREGYKEAAQRFRYQAEQYSDAQGDTQAYRNVLRAGQLQYAMEMAKKLFNRFNSDNYMYFHMQQMQLIELIRQRKVKKPELGSKPTMTTIELTTSQTQAEHSQEESKEPLISFESKESMDPRLVFLIKLILWAQSKLDNDMACVDNFRLEIDGDFELELLHALQHSV